MKAGARVWNEYSQLRLDTSDHTLRLTDSIYVGVQSRGTVKWVPVDGFVAGRDVMMMVPALANLARYDDPSPSAPTRVLPALAIENNGCHLYYPADVAYQAVRILVMRVS